MRPTNLPDANRPPLRALNLRAPQYLVEIRRPIARCSGQVFSDTAISCFTAKLRSYAVGAM